MASTIDTAFVEIEPKFDQFGPQLRRGIDGALQSAVASVRQASNAIERAFETSAEQAERALREVGSSGAFNDVVQQATRAGDAVDRAFSSADDAADSAFQDVENSAREAANVVQTQLNQAGESAERSLNEVGDRADREFGRVQQEARTASDGIGNGFRRTAATLFAAFAALQVGQFFVQAAQGAQELNSAIATTEQVIASTGSAAGLLAEDIRALSDELSLEIGVDDAQIQEAANVLLTFKNVSSDVFGTALGLSADLASVLKTDLNSSVLQVGKALNDPIRGVTALSRAGVQFTTAQRAQIKALVQSNDLYGAQAIILQELESQVGGAAAASASAASKIAVAFDNVKDSLGAGLVDAVDSLAPALGAAFTSLAPTFGILGDLIGELLTAAEPLITVFGETLGQVFAALAPAIAPVGQAFADVFTAVAPLIVVLAQLLGTVLPPLATVISAVATALGPVISLFAEFIGGVLVTLQPLLMEVATAIAVMVEQIGPSLTAAVAAILPLLLQLLQQVLVPLIPAFVQLVTAITPLIPPLLQIVTVLLPPLLQLLTLLLPPVVALNTGLLNLAAVGVQAFSIALAGMITSLTAGSAGMAAFSKSVQSQSPPIHSALVGIGSFFSGLTDTIGAALRRTGRAIAVNWNTILTFFRAIPGRIVGALASFGTLLLARGRQLMAGLRSGVVTGFSGVWDFLRSIFGRVLGVFASAASWLVGAGARILSGLRRGLVSGLAGVLGFVRSIRDRVVGFFAGAGNWLFAAGKKIIGGLVDGIKSAAGAVGDAIGDIASTASSYWPFSPAKTGPLREHPMDQAGANVVRDLVRGLNSGLPDLKGTTESLSRQVSVGAQRDFGSAQGVFRSGSEERFQRDETPVGAQRPMVIELRSDGTQLGDALLAVLQKSINVRGGNVQTVLGSQRGIRS